MRCDIVALLVYYLIKKPIKAIEYLASDIVVLSLGHFTIELGSLSYPYSCLISLIPYLETYQTYWIILLASER